MSTLGNVISAAPVANDNALAEYLASEPAQQASLRTVLSLARLAKCGAVQLTTNQLHALQRVLEAE